MPDESSDNILKPFGKCVVESINMAVATRHAKSSGAIK
jgi:hypothetical protein